MTRMLQWQRDLDPQELLDWDCDWENDLGVDTILSSTWRFDSQNADGALSKSSPSATNTVAKIWLTGGTPGVTYRLINTIVTTASRTFERTVQIRVIQR